jgi:UDP-N-acetyl-2-amino-2-deoxyglucuronate dehydrogenase
MSGGQARSTFRVGIIGCGRIANSHVQAVLDCPDAELGALVDPVQERAAALAATYSSRAPTYPNLADALRRIDGAVIASPKSPSCQPSLAVPRGRRSTAS